MENVRITVKVNGLDRNGNKKFLYNFYKDGENISRYFNRLGRVTKNGVNSQLAPFRVEEFFNKPFYRHDLKTFTELGKAQKRIDRCNKKQGCLYYCSNSQINCCDYVMDHRRLIDELSLVSGFKGCKVEQV